MVKKVFDKLTKKFVRVTEKDYELIKVSFYWQQRYDLKIKENNYEENNWKERGIYKSQL